MKKIIVLIVIFLSFSNIVLGETFYGEFRKVDDITNYPMDMVKVKNLKLFNTYKIKYIDIGYMPENDLYIKDINDYKEEYLEVDAAEESDEYIDIGPFNQSVTYITVGGLENNMKIYEFEMYINDELFDYSYPITSVNIINKIRDNNLKT